jgi:hypothetical protein
VLLSDDFVCVLGCSTTERRHSRDDGAAFVDDGGRGDRGCCLAVATFEACMLPFVVNVYLQGGSRERERERDGSVV